MKNLRVVDDAGNVIETLPDLNAMDEAEFQEWALEFATRLSQAQVEVA
jgi:hypothetical protein